MVGAYIGSRDIEGAKGLWDSLPPVYRQCAVSYTDFWQAYDAIFPSFRHKSVGKETGLTSLLERVNCTKTTDFTLSSENSFPKSGSPHI